MIDYQSTIEICRRRYIFKDFLCFHTMMCVQNCICVKILSYNVFFYRVECHSLQLQL